MRRGSVPDRSPLQNLETWSKEEKRARLQQAEHKARQRSVVPPKGEGEPLRHGTLRNEKDRIVSDPERRQSGRDKSSGKSRQVSDPISPTSPETMSPARKFQHASDALRNGRVPRDSDANRPYEPAPHSARPTEAERASASPVRHASQRPARTGEVSAGESTDLSRSHSGKYSRRARDASFTGDEATYNAKEPWSQNGSAAERGKAAYERRKASIPNETPISPVEQDPRWHGPGVGRSSSKRIPNRSPLADEYETREALQTDRVGGLDGSRKDREAAQAYQRRDPIPPQQVQGSPRDRVKYTIPPQTAAAQEARAQVGFGGTAEPLHDEHQREKHHRFGHIFHHDQHGHRSYTPTGKPLDDWRRAKAARLTVDDLDIEQAFADATKGDDGDNAWWEKGTRRSSSTTSRAGKTIPQYDGTYEEQASGFSPRLFLKCGPLLRYTGIRREAASIPRDGRRASAMAGREFWHGSIMIVTEDGQSDLASTPVLRIFAQPMNLHEPPPRHVLESGHELPPEFEDPVAGQVKLSRTGRALYVRPVHEIKGGIDLSREENNEGLYSATRTPVLGPQSSSGPDGRLSQHITFQDKSRIKKRDGERAGRYREVKAARLHTERGFTFWRFNIEIELGSKQYRVAYRINQGPAIGFWVPARGETMNMMFHSCNGFSLSVDPNNFSGPDPLWRDVLNRHQARPFHLMIGGGDQIYNDAAMRDTELFREWLQTKSPEHKYSAGFTTEMQEELEEFYLNRYAMWFSQGLYSMANSQIPQVNLWDDHDIIDGYGSYPHHFMSTSVFTGLGAVAHKYYMLFQHQSLTAETEREEPSWLLGKSPGPYINELSRNIFMSLGNKVAFLGMDCRTERMRDEILSQETYDTIFDRCRTEIITGQTKHLIVLLGVPIAYPRLNFLENILTSKVMDPIKAIGRTGMLGGFVNKFDGGVEILDDLDDHWTAKHHKAERNWFIQELQELAAEKSVRVTILGGDVHLGAVGQFYSAKKLGISKDRDHRYMPNVVSSAIVNTPPPNVMADVLNKRNKVHHLDDDTDEDMIPMFSHDVDGSRRNNNHLLPRRNFCIISEYLPGSTRPSTPVLERSEQETPAPANFGADAQDGRNGKDRRFPPGSMKRTMSLTRGPVGGLVRRLSGSKSRNPPLSLAPEHARAYEDNEDALEKPVNVQRSNSLSAPNPGESYFDGVRRPSFHRRPTNLSAKEAKRATAAADGREPGHIDLEGGLDISLCMEVDQDDPAGATVPYRLLVPALFYEGPLDVNTARFKSRRGSLMDRLKGYRKREMPNDREQEMYGDENGGWSGSEGSRSPSPEGLTPAERREQLKALRSEDAVERNTAANALGLTSTGRGAFRETPLPINKRSGPMNGGSPRDATPRDFGNRKSAFPQQIPSDQSRPSSHAYSQGYNLSSPPLGSTSQPLRSQAGPANNNPYPQSGYRSASARGLPEGAHDGSGSLTPSEEYRSEDEEGRRFSPVRRGSKAERFFGIGEARRGSQMDDEGRAEGGRKKVNWKIWQGRGGL